MFFKKILPVALAALFAPVAPVSADSYFFSGENEASIAGSDMLYQETRYPVWCQAVYNARWFPDIGGPDNRGVSFYSGPVWWLKDEKGVREIAYIQSFWAIHNPIRPGDSVTPERWPARFNSAASIGEGASGKVEGRLTLSTDVWYPTLVRLWRPTGNPPNVSKCGQWCREGLEGKWTHVSTFNIPFVADRFTGEYRKFIEGLNRAYTLRRVDSRNFYFRKNGRWNPGKTFYAVTRGQQRGNAGVIENDSAAFFELSDDPNLPANIIGDKTAKYTLTMPETPTFDAAIVKGVEASATDTQVFVKWSIPETSAPQFAYKVEVFADESAAGEPVKTVEMIDPDARAVGVDVAGLSNPSVRLTITDIFDKKADPVTVPASPAKLASAVTEAVTAGGLNYEYYEGDWKKLPAFDSLTPVRSGALNGLDIGVHRRPAGYAMRFRGRVAIPADGVWNFGLKASDGVRLVIDGAVVIDSDGIHGIGYEVSGSAGLKAGKHAVELTYFKAQAAGPESGIALTWAGPGLAKSAVPGSAWSRTPRVGEPSMVLKMTASGPADSSVSASVSAAGQTLQSVRFYDENSCRGAASESKREGSSHIFSGVFPFGVGAQKVKARLIYGKNGEYTLDTPPTFAVLTQPDIGAWKFSAIGSHVFHPLSAVSADGVHSLVGDNLNINWRLVAGDTTIVARLKRRPSPVLLSQFNGAAHDHWWSGGIIFRQDLNGNPGGEIGTKFVTLLSRVGGGWYLQDQTNSNANGYFDVPVGTESPNANAYSWVKLKREKNIFTAYLSVDGSQWDLVGTRDMSAQGFNEAMHVGVYALARPSINPNPNYWQFDSVSLGNDPQAPKKIPDLAARWAMDEVAGERVADATHQGNDGLVAGFPSRVTGISGKAMSLNGSTQSVSFLAPGLYSNKATFSGWVKRSGPQAAWSGILTTRSGITAGMMFGPSDELRFMWETGGNSMYNFRTGLIVPDGVWTFVALKVEPTKVTLHMRPKGGEMKTKVCDGTFAPIPFDSDLHLGADLPGADRYFKGAMDEFRIYRRALSADEIKKLSEGR